MTTEAARGESRPAGPRGGQVPCSGCGAVLDPLRAGHVAIFNARFHFFCSRARCRARFAGEPERDDVEERAAPPPDRFDAVLPPVQPAPATTLEDYVPPAVRVDDHGDLIEPVVEPVMNEGPPEMPLERRELGFVLVALSLIAGGLAMALELGESTRLLRLSRTLLIGVGTAALMGRALTMRPEPALGRRPIVFIAPLLATVVAVWAVLAGSAAQLDRAAFVGGTVLTVAAMNVWLVGAAAAPVEVARRWIAQRLDVPGWRISGEPTSIAHKELVFDLAPGDQVVVEAGDSVPVDLEIQSGEVEVLPWVGAATRVKRRAGDVVVAGSRVTHGHLRGRCTWAGEDRALARPVLCRERRADIHALVPKSGRRIAEQAAPLFALLLGVGVVLLGYRALDVAMVVVAVYAAVGNLAVASLASLAVARGVSTALGRGVIYNDAKAWDACARVTAAVFCARGTLLRGEPELVEIEVFQPGERPADDEVLALAAGALSAERDPAAIAVRRAAADRGLMPQPVRNLRSFEGRGVTAVAATGEELCVGTKNLLLERHTSVAVAEQKIYELETAGRTVMLVAKAGRVIGLLALKDGLRAGARAAVQHLLDAKIEPVLMSADARQTCEALGRALDIDHLRPEVVDEERAAAIQRIRDTGAVVAVLGHSPHDDVALEAADASVAVANAGRERDRFSVSLVSDDVRDAAIALALAHQTRRLATTVLALVLVPAALGAAVVAAGLLPAEFAPLAQLIGALTAVWQLRATDG